MSCSGVLAADPPGVDRQTVRRVGYTVAGLCGLGLYLIGTRTMSWWCR
ncbi:MAG: hypothetical protein J07HB67_02246, partial [halophilic archaeon J07HB67]